MGISGKRISAGEIEAMMRLRVLGWSLRQVARELDYEVRTVLKYAPQWRVDERRRREAAEDNSKNLD
jgi:hypothetical protein